MANLWLSIGIQEKSTGGLKIEKYSLTYFLSIIFSSNAMVA